MLSLQRLFIKLKKLVFRDNSSNLRMETERVATEWVATVEELIQLSNHRDGYKRENAAAKLGYLGDPIAIPSLLLRVNDWVPQVRAAAIKSLKKLIITEHLDSIIQCLPHIYHLRECHRADHEHLIQHIEVLLLAESNESYLLDGLHNVNSDIARLCLQLAIRSQFIDVANLLSVAFLSKDVLVRMNTFRWAKKMHPDELESYYSSLLKDAFMPIRKESLRYLLCADDADTVAKNALFDHHTSVRELAIKYCLENGEDAVSLYRNNFTTSVKTKAAIWGLGYLNSHDDLEKIKSFYNSVTPSLRKQALNSLLRLDPQNSEIYLLKGLKDPAPSVCKNSAKLIVKVNVHVGVNELIRIIDESVYTHTALSCVAISHHLNKWDRAVFLLSWTVNEKMSSTLKEAQFAAELGIWNSDYNRSFIQPTQAQIATLKALMASVGIEQKSKQWKGLISTITSTI
ncbi:HEAT repeat domain-containing protein [Pseudoalteromonas sp. MMG013]|uniref:HEAT repeat domain-containing protein n=1 Tax=Pseudoalteromonas sp. MMG013 TaxID=2822687 RepID=UPI001B380B40|nr:HEAT repeat domain-containing protein [Pseudoalteromonas sp. MMG013]MBQ4862684.1 HEAT repeat domain-containing protein [Pseudoalteromonas sp. MMG013]